MKKRKKKITKTRRHTPRSAAKRVAALRRAAGAAHRAAATADRRVVDCIVAHIRKNPLDPAVVDALAAHLAAGRPLCCKVGHEHLKTLVPDPLWAEVLHAWAYDRLGCSPNDRPYYVAKLRDFVLTQDGLKDYCL